MSNNDIIHAPTHYVTGRTIEPIEVIENYRLGHHLSCVVKYIARAGRKNPILEDLNKAAWYLKRACLMGPEDLILWGPVGDDERFMPETIISDWSLSPNLGRSLTTILQFASGSCEGLLPALQALLTEIRYYQDVTGLYVDDSCEEPSFVLERGDQ